MMNQIRFPFHRIHLPLALILLSACGREPSETDSFRYKMGEKVIVGQLIYTVLEAEWRTQLPGGEGLPQTPQHRFLLLKVSITNSGGSQVTLPLLTLENRKKEGTLEVADAKNLPGWLGLIRFIKPAQTDQGYIVFDVPTGAYKLRATDGNEPDTETTRLIDIPLSLSEPVRTN